MKESDVRETLCVLAGGHVPGLVEGAYDLRNPDAWVAICACCKVREPMKIAIYSWKMKPGALTPFKDIRHPGLN